MCNERRRVVGRESWPTGYDEQNNQDVKCAARRAALQWRHFAYARHGVPCLELARAELRPTPAPPVPTAEEVAEAGRRRGRRARWRLTSGCRVSGCWGWTTTAWTTTTAEVGPLGSPQRRSVGARAS